MVRYGLALAAGILVLDQIAKFLILEALHFSPPGCLRFAANCGAIELSPIFDLRMVWNYGVSFGMLRAGGDLARWGLVILSALIAGMFFHWLRSADRRLTATALGLVIGGAIGNMIDRIRFGAVADFFDFSGLLFPWVFNVADAAITVGAGLLALDFLVQGRAERRAAAAPPPQNGQDRGGSVA